MDEAVRLSDISKVYRVPSVLPWRPARRTLALDGVSFTCPAGRISCLLGPNGAGKTTVIKILAGLITADGGTGSILGQPLERLGQRFQRRIGLVVANERSLYWRLTGRQNLDFFASMYGLSGRERRRRVDQVLVEVDMRAEADKPVRLYSSGMKQRLSLARALLGRPEIFLLDEPTNHLDPNAKARLHRFVMDRLVGERRATILLCTNDLAECQTLAEHLVLLDGGTVVAEGSLAEIREKIQSGTRLVLEFAELPPAGWETPLGLRAIRNGDNSLEVLVPDEKRVPEITAAAATEGKLLRCEHVKPSLGEIFAAFTDKPR